MKRDHEFMTGLARNVLRMPQDTRQDAYDRAYWQVIEGKDCAFYATDNWSTVMDGPMYDNEQHVRLFCAIKLAASLIAATPADRWRVIENALRAEAETYARHVADERGAA